MIARFEGESRPDAGIEPDLRVDPTIEDVRAGRDPELEAVKRLLAAGR